ncbi:MAG: hypothetical protein QOK44_691 [Betaproteobacteria bacterium]|nr:hypothetical protein [Betaproteobacteria bacterium]
MDAGNLLLLQRKVSVREATQNLRVYSEQGLGAAAITP